MSTAPPPSVLAPAGPRYPEVRIRLPPDIGTSRMQLVARCRPAARVAGFAAGVGERHREELLELFTREVAAAPSFEGALDVARRWFHVTF